MKRTKRKRWVRKFDADLALDKNLTIPTQIISNEEFAPAAQTFEQRLVEHKLIELSDCGARKLNISRRSR
jgi:hypothetical protein